MRIAIVLAAIAAAIAGCGGGGVDRRARAQEAVRVAASALDEARSSGGEDASITQALDRSQHWLEQTEQGVELWGSSGSLAYETAAPCLARSLSEVRAALTAAGREVPMSLEEAEALVLDEGVGRCATRSDPGSAAAPGSR